MRSIVKRNKNVNIILWLNNIILEKVCSHKYLGLISDDQLNFNKHINEMTRTVSPKLYLLSRIRRYLNKEACTIIFKTMVLSIMEYGDIIYKIEKLFYRGLRICDASEVKIVEEQLCENCDIVPLENRRYLHLLLQ